MFFMDKLKKFLNPFCFACSTLGLLPCLPLHKGKWVQLNGQTLLSCEVRKTQIVTKVPNFYQKYLIFHVTTKNIEKKLAQTSHIEVGPKLIWNKSSWMRLQNFLIPIMLGIVHFQKPLELGVLTRAVPHGTLVWPHLGSTLKNRLQHRAASIGKTSPWSHPDFMENNTAVAWWSCLSIIHNSAHESKFH